MRFLKPWQDISISPLALLDAAYVVVLLPLLLILKVPMLVFVVIVLGLLFFKREPAGNMLVLFVFLMGVVAVYLSLYGAFSFRGLSRLKLFLELLVYVLIVVVSMQRLTQKINFYLLISPMLFLALSLFFFHKLPMLIYVVFEIFFLLWMILSHRMEGNLIESFRSSMVMFMYSLPWVVVLFIFFPRISFEHASYGFKGETERRMGHDGTMYLDNKALLVPSDRIVMEVGFEGDVPASNLLYFRGSLLYLDKKDHWEPIPPYIKRTNNPTLIQGQEPTSYKVTLYPTQKNWLYLLDMPYKNVKDATIDTDLVSTTKKPIKEPIHYAGLSYLSSRLKDDLDEITTKAATAYDQQQNPKTFIEAQKIKTNYASDEERLQAVHSFFQQQSLVYSLNPPALDINRTTDSFLFDRKKGYCVHFASSYVTMARMAGIPARIVTGYKADKTNALNNYLAVKEKDAHAWAEVYIDGSWVRVETTSTASHIDAQTQTQLNAAEEDSLYNSINLYLMYAKYQVETWILYYSNLRQLQLLKYAKENPKFIFIFVMSLLLLVVISFFIIAYFRRPRHSSEALGTLEPLLKLMSRQGFVRKDNETLHQYFMRYLGEHPERKIIYDIDKYYEQISYGEDRSKETLKQLNKLVKKAIKTKTTKL